MTALSLNYGAFSCVWDSNFVLSSVHQLSYSSICRVEVDCRVDWVQLIPDMASISKISKGILAN